MRETWQWPKKNERHFDSAIIGTGQAAPALAAALAGRGERVALIEGHLLGGSCVNVGCTPTKTLRKSARVAHLARRAADFGVDVGDVSVDFATAMARMRAGAEASRAGLQSWMEGTDGIDIICGWGAFDGLDGDGFALRVGGQSLCATKVYLNTGTRAFTPPVPGLEDVPHLDNVSLLALRKRPQHLIIVGGSYICLEIGQIFRRLGSQVTIVNHGPRLAAGEDTDVSAILQEMFEAEDVRILNNASVVATENTASGVALILGDNTRVSGSHILFATGRNANSERLNLHSVGVETDVRGFIKTDAQLRTNVAGVWALGDINGRGAFTHTSYHDHEIILAHLPPKSGPLHQWRGADQRPTTYAMFTDPPLGRVGISLADAQDAVNNGRNILVATRAMADVGRAREESETTGLLRIIVDGDSEQILGATVLGISGDEVIAVLSNYMASGTGYRYMQQALPIHPTVSELLPTMLGALLPLEAQ